MKARLTNYNKSVWKGKDSEAVGYYGLSSKKKSSLKKETTKSEKSTKAPAKTKRKKTQMEAERIQANPKIMNQVMEMLLKTDSKEKNQKKTQEEEVKAEQTKQQEVERKEIDLCTQPEGYEDLILERKVTNLNILNEKQELRRIKTEYDEEKISIQREASSKIDELERQKGVSFQSKVMKKFQLEDKEGDFGFNDKTIPSTYTLSRWEKKNIVENTIKSLEPEAPTDFYDLKFDSQGVYSWSCQANLQSELEKVKSDLGDRDYNRLRELFEYYAAVINPLQMGKIESYQFHLFLKDHDLYTEQMDRTQATLKLKKAASNSAPSDSNGASNSKSANFEGFCQILYDLALAKYPWEKNKSLAFRQYVKHSVFSKKFTEKEKKFEKVLDELYSPGVQDYLADKKKMVYYVELFENNCKEIHADGKTVKVIDIIQANKLSIDLGIIPDVISKLNFVKLFKFCQPSENSLSSRAKYREYLLEEEFKHLIAAIGIFVFNQDAELKNKYHESKKHSSSKLKSEQKAAAVMKQYTKER
ncbi:unnamed protein product [Moneuplotes crassus]|uniref:Uncharacterized protein n=1 Tax=Euplotes crassus TaxID=5936 RepID=A0AAD1UHN3_EUPCR|nr:unnamed protein product [Moneuplotes crassus]